MFLLLLTWLCAVHLVVGNEFNVMDNNSSPNTIELKVNQSFANKGDGIMGKTPYFTKPDSLQKLIVKPSGNMIRLVCNVQGSPEPTLTWTKDDSVIIRVLDAVKYRKFAIILEDIIPNDSGNYTCKACNEHGCIEHTTKLDVVDRISSMPIIELGYPKNITVFVNHTAEFECPTLHLSIYRPYIDWVKIRDQNRTQILTQNRVSGILRLDNVTIEDEGWYTCFAINNFGKTSAKGYLTVVADSPVDPVKLPMHGLPIWHLIVIIILMTIFIIAIGIAFAIFKKLQSGKRNKNFSLENETMMCKNSF